MSEDLNFVDEINGKEYEEFPEYKLLPEGQYKAEIAKVDVKSKDNGDKFVVIGLNINHKGDDYSVLNNMWVKYSGNIKAEQVGQGIMKRLYNILGYPSIPKENIGVIVSKNVGVEIVHTKSVSKKTGKDVTYANVKKFIAGDYGYTTKPKETKNKPENFDEDIEF